MLLFKKGYGSIKPVTVNSTGKIKGFTPTSKLREGEVYLKEMEACVNQTSRSFCVANDKKANSSAFCLGDTG